MLRAPYKVNSKKPLTATTYKVCWSLKGVRAYPMERLGPKTSSLASYPLG